MAKKQFKAESKRLLDLMINSIYTHQEIFLREIISNASDAIDKLAYLALTDENVGLSRSDFAIQLKPDETARTLTVSDNGIGMDKEQPRHDLPLRQSAVQADARQGQGRRHRHHRPVRRGLLLGVHGRGQGDRHLEEIRLRRGLEMGIRGRGRLHYDPV